MAGLFAQQVRSCDLVAKYGGDEFTHHPAADRSGGRDGRRRARARRGRGPHVPARAGRARSRSASASRCSRRTARPTSAPDRRPPTARSTWPSSTAATGSRPSRPRPRDGGATRTAPARVDPPRKRAARLRGPGRARRVRVSVDSAREASVAETIGIAVVGTGDWGANLVRNFARAAGRAAGRAVRHRPAAARQDRRASTRGAARRRRRRATSPRAADVQARGGRRLRRQPLPARQGAARGGQGRVRREAADARGRARRGAGAARRASATASSWSATCCSTTPAVRYLKEHGATRRAGRPLLPLFAAREPGQGAPRRERAVELRARTTSR